jgi:hypothetical protein
MEADTVQQDTGRILPIFLDFLPSMVLCVSWCLAVPGSCVSAFLSCGVQFFSFRTYPFLAIRHFSVQNMTC